MKACLQFFFVVKCVYIVPVLYSRGLLHTRHLRYVAEGLPTAALGLALGLAVYNCIDLKTFQRLVILALFLRGFSYIVAG